MLSTEPVTRTEKRNCKQHGEYEATLTKTPFNKKWMGGHCPQCQDRNDCIETTNHSSSSLNCNIPKRFRDCSLNNYKVNQGLEQQLAFQTINKYAEKYLERFEMGGGLILYGKCGTGKTHLACALANHIIAKYKHDCRYSKVYEMIDEIKESWNNNHTNQQHVINSYAKPDLLILDEIGIQYGTQSEELLIFRVLNKRYEEIKPTIIVSNLNDEGLTAYLGERVIDRLNENGGAKVAFTWPSHRRLHK